jgi:bifunctional N-acetylglucosamine-1-phosphate-uridyltransferase/glucosamine-1-phosphate-acetyltransferase GlmU-like protein
MREFNASLYGFHGHHLRRLLTKLRPDNVQGEIYLTDLIYLFLEAGLVVQATPAPSEEVVLDFNDKPALRRLEAIRRRAILDQIKHLVTLEDEEDFFIADPVVEQILEMGRTDMSPDLFFGQGVYVGSGVNLSPRVQLRRQARLDGNIQLGAGVRIGASAQLSTLPHQSMVVGEETEVLDRNIIKGNMVIGRRCRIETTVRMTGSDEHPMRVGDNVRIKGTTYLYGCRIEDNVFLQNCYLFRKRIRFRKDAQGRPLRIAHIFPAPVGAECVDDL